MGKSATIQVPSFKIAVPLSAAALPRDLVPMDGPAGEPVIDLVLEGGSLRVRARINGKNYRKMIKQIDENGAGKMAIVLQGALRAPAGTGEPFVLEGAGFQAVLKAPKGGPSSGSTEEGT